MRTQEDKDVAGAADLRIMFLILAFLPKYFKNDF